MQIKNTKSVKEEKASPGGMYQKQKRATILFAVFAILLAIGAAVAFYFVNLDATSFEQGGVRYRVKEKNGVYVLVDDEGYTCDITSDGYYVTKDGKMLVSVDTEAGTYSVYATVDDLEDTESVGNVVTRRILIFPHVSQSKTQAIEVHNEHGSYAFYRGASGDFRVKGTESSAATYNKELFTTLVVTSGYLLAQDKIVDPIIDENGTFSEYGLDDSETYWIITTQNDEVYKIIVGDATPSNGGYYIQYVACSDVVLNDDGTVVSMTETPRKAVYILSNTLASTILEPIETLMTPEIVYPMTLTTYFDVQNFFLFKGDEPVIGLNFVDLEQRSYSEQSSVPYQMLLQEHKGFTPHSNNVMGALEGFYDMNFTSVIKLAPSEEELIEYGIFTNAVATFIEGSGENETYYYAEPIENGGYAVVDEDGKALTQDADGNYVTEGGAVLRIDPETGNGETVSGSGMWDLTYDIPYSIYYDFDVKDAATGAEYTTEQSVWFSHVTKQDTRYAYSPVYDMIVEIAAFDLAFLDWEFFDWIESAPFSINVSFMESLILETPDGTETKYTFNNSESSQGSIEAIKENAIEDSTGRSYYKKKVDGVYGVFKSTGPEYPVAYTAYFRVSDKTATKADLFISYFELPSGGKSEGWFEGKVYVMPSGDLIICDVEGSYWGVAKYQAASGKLAVFCNNDPVSDIANFREFYKTLLYATIEEEYVLTDEEEAALIGNPDNFKLRLRAKSFGSDLVFEFYTATSRKSYMRVSGDGGETFKGDIYMLTARVNKIVSDIEKLRAGEPIDPTAKN